MKKIFKSWKIRSLLPALMFFVTCWLFIVYASSDGLFSNWKINDIRKSLTEDDWNSLMDALDTYAYLPEGAIIATSLTECPEWWNKYTAANQWRFLKWSNFGIWTISWSHYQIVYDSTTYYNNFVANDHVNVLYCIKWEDPQVDPEAQCIVNFENKNSGRWYIINKFTWRCGDTINVDNQQWCVTIWSSQVCASPYEGFNFGKFVSHCWETSINECTIDVYFDVPEILYCKQWYSPSVISNPTESNLKVFCENAAWWNSCGLWDYEMNYYVVSDIVWDNGLFNCKFVLQQHY